MCTTPNANFFTSEFDERVRHTDLINSTCRPINDLVIFFGAERKAKKFNLITCKSYIYVDNM